MYKGWKQLNKEDREHLKTTGAFQKGRGGYKRRGGCTTEALKSEFRYQKRLGKSRNEKGLSCPHCERIGKKLGYIK